MIVDFCFLQMQVAKPVGLEEAKPLGLEEAQQVGLEEAKPLGLEDSNNRVLSRQKRFPIFGFLRQQ